MKFADVISPKKSTENKDKAALLLHIHKQTSQINRHPL
jgi:hypothetical protein